MNNRSLFPRRSARSVPLEWVRQQNESPRVRLSVEPKKLTPDDLLREALKDDPIAEMAKLITQRHAIQQSINTLLPKMTKDEVTEVYHTLYSIAQKVNERESWYDSIEPHNRPNLPHLPHTQTSKDSV